MWPELISLQALTHQNPNKSMEMCLVTRAISEKNRVELTAFRLLVRLLYTSKLQNARASHE